MRIADLLQGDNRYKTAMALSGIGSAMRGQDNSNMLTQMLMFDQMKSDKADKAAQDAQWRDQAAGLFGGGMGGGSVSTRGAAVSGGPMPKGPIVDYIRQAAKRRGIDPDIAVRVAASEGLNADPNEAWQSKVVKNGKRERSYGPFQLYIDGGLGNEFMRDTGLDPRDSSTWQAQVDYALDHAAKNGWGAWYGARNIGLDNMAGIGQGAQAVGVSTRGSQPQRGTGMSPDRARQILMLAGQGNPYVQEFVPVAQDVLKRAAEGPDKGPSSVQEYRFYVQDQRARGEKPLSYAQWSVMDETAAAGGGAAPVPVGNDGGVMVPDPNSPSGWRYEIMEGSPLQRELQSEAMDRASGAAKIGEGQRQARVKMPLTLDNIAANVAEIENGGVPVTGMIGAAGRLLPGTAQSDFGVRHNQVTTAAALAEIQQMRNTNPTGGAVGQLTDSERVAISEAATGMSLAQSKEEYVKAAKRYRQIMLDIAYKGQKWEIDPTTGEVILYPPTQGADQNAPEGVDPAIWEEMTPQERALWK